MEYTGKLYGKIGRRMIPLTLTSEDVDELERQRDAHLQKGRENAALAGDLLSENRRLKLALSRATKWGIRSDGFSAEVSDSLRIWFDGGMVGDPPAVPSYYPDNSFIEQHAVFVLQMRHAV
jgi:hypothetical protein